VNGWTIGNQGQVLDRIDEIYWIEKLKWLARTRMPGSNTGIIGTRQETLVCFFSILFIL
jgi:hypothetical protein